MLAILFAAMAAFGANADVVALLAAVLEALLLIGVVSTRWGRRGLASLPVLLPAGLFLGAIAVAMASWVAAPAGVAAELWAQVGVKGVAAIDRGADLIALVRLGGLGCLFLATAAIQWDAERDDLVLGPLRFVGYAYLTATMLLFAASPDHLLGLPKFMATDRFTATFISPNNGAMAAGAVLLLAASALIRAIAVAGSGGASVRGVAGEVLRHNAIDVAGAGLAFIALLATRSRMGLAATLLMLTVLIGWEIWIRPNRLRNGLAALGAGVVALLVIQFAGGPLAPRLQQLGPDLQVRLAIYGPHMAAIDSAPWTGYGLGSFHAVNAAIVQSGDFTVLRQVGALHDVYLQWMEQAGPVGAGLMFACIAALILAAIDAGRRRSGRWARCVVVIAGLFALEGLTDYALEMPALQALLAILLGVGIGLSATRRRARARRTLIRATDSDFHRPADGAPIILVPSVAPSPVLEGEAVAPAGHIFGD